jgi:hypothetical protein
MFLRLQMLGKLAKPCMSSFNKADGRGVVLRENVRPAEACKTELGSLTRFTGEKQAKCRAVLVLITRVR